jgi:hypothetical protein
MAGSGCAGWSAFQYHSETGERGDPCLFLTDKQRPRGRPAAQRALLRNDGHGAWQYRTMAASLVALDHSSLIISIPC